MSEQHNPVAPQLARAAVLGIIMLDTAFTRFPGDIGNPATFADPVHYRVVPGATARAVTEGETEVAPFLDVARALVADGADAIVTSCGFLVIHQRALARALSVPVISSALLQLPFLESELPPGRRAGVMTFNADTLGARHLAAAGARPDTTIAGLPAGGTFRRAILGDPTRDSFAARQSEALDAARRLQAAEPKLGAIVLECTNLVPHAGAIRLATGVPVYDILTGLARCLGDRMPNLVAETGARR